MMAPVVCPPISATICNNAWDVVQILRNLAGSGFAFRRAVKSLSVSILVGELRLGFDIQREFLDIYPNLRELDLTGFDYLMGCTPDDLRRTGGRGKEPSSEQGVFSLRRLTLEAYRLEPHSMRMLFEQTRRMPHLSHLQLSKFAFQSGKDLYSSSRLPYTLDRYLFLVDDDAAEGSSSSRGWAAPFAACFGNASPKSLTVSFCDRRDFKELKNPDIDLSHVRRLSLVFSRFPLAVDLSDYGALVGRCSGLKDLYICVDQSRLVAELLSLLSNLTGPLHTIAVVTFPPDPATLVLNGVEAELLKALELPQTKALRQFDMAIFNIFDAELPSQSFPLVAASCRARRIQFACVIDDPNRFM